jgi:type IV pilus assembly protein PilC
MASLGYSQLEFMAMEMASLARANIPLSEGLRRLAHAAQSARLRKAYNGLAASMERGHSLASALAGASAPREFVAAIQCAEASGDMAQVLEFAVAHCRRVDKFYGGLANVALYPVLVISIAVPILTALCLVVVPEFETIFAQLGGPLPPPTELMIGLSQLLQNGVGLGILAASLIVFLWACSPWFAKTMPYLLQRLPLFGGLVMLSDAAMLMRFLERMLARGLPLPTVLRAASLAVWGRALRRRLMVMADQAERGATAFDSLSGVLPALPLHLLQQAEERGDLVATCPGVASYCEDRFEMRAQSYQQWLEPVLIVILGVLVGSLVISLYLPLFEIPTRIQ